MGWEVAVLWVRYILFQKGMQVDALSAAQNRRMVDLLLSVGGLENEDLCTVHAMAPNMQLVYAMC